MGQSRRRSRDIGCGAPAPRLDARSPQAQRLDYSRRFRRRPAPGGRGFHAHNRLYPRGHSNYIRNSRPQRRNSRSRCRCRAPCSALELSRFLPGLVGGDWRGRSRYACLTGNCQMALIWFRLHSLSRNLRLINAALKAIDLVKLAQPMRNPNPGLFGGIPGSDPIHGAYIEGAVPNWAAKYFIDALLEKRRLLSELRTEPARPAATVGTPGGPIVPGSASAPGRRLSTVMLTTVRSQKVSQMLSAWRGRDIGNLTVVVEHPVTEKRTGQATPPLAE